MSDRPSKNSTDNRLYVEGADDFHVICALVRKAGVAWTATDARIPLAPNTNGDKDALEQAAVAVKNRTPCVGLVIDADTDARGRWREIKTAFAAVELPEVYPDDGLVTPFDRSDEAPGRLGIWIMPRGGLSGAIEVFLDSMVPGSSLKTHAYDATDQARRQHGATFADKDVAKAKLRAWLAWQQAPGAPYGRAIDLGYLSAHSDWAKELVEWFRRVYLA